MKILNLFAGVGGNRSAWGSEHHVTAIENNQQVAFIYFSRFPEDQVIINDAYEYVIAHFKEFDFIWASPPCQTHTFLNRFLVQQGRIAKLPDLRLYSLIYFLRAFFKGIWIVENVNPYYDPLIKPDLKLGRYIFWCNFYVASKKFTEREYFNSIEKTARVKQIDLEFIKQFPQTTYRRDQLLRDAVNPKISAHIFKFVEKRLKIDRASQKSLEEF